MSSKNTYILGIESSCDDTAAAILCNGKVLSNVVANQAIHEKYGGVVPELASRAHQQNIVPVVDQAIKQAGITLEDLSAVAFTQGPGLMGSLLVGTSFAKSLAYGLNIPLIDVNHMQAHILAHFIEKEGSSTSKINLRGMACVFTRASCPFLCFTKSKKPFILSSISKMLGVLNFKYCTIQIYNIFKNNALFFCI